MPYFKSHDSTSFQTSFDLEIFKAIIREEPSYTDAYMKLAYRAQRRGDMKRAIDYIEYTIVWGAA